MLEVLSVIRHLTPVTHFLGQCLRASYLKFLNLALKLTCFTSTITSKMAWLVSSLPLKLQAHRSTEMLLLLLLLN